MKQGMRKSCARIVRRVPLLFVAAGLVFALAPAGCERSPSSRSVTAAAGDDAPRPGGEKPVRPRSPNALVDALVRENLDAELAEHPIEATWLGVHAWDDRIDDVRAEAQARRALRLQRLVERLRAIDDKSLDATHAFDRLLLERRADAELFTLTELRPLEKNPMAYCDLAQSAIYELVSDDYLPSVERLRALNGRLWKLRPLFDEARRNLRGGASELAVRRAIDEAQAEKGFITDTLPMAMQGVPDPKLLEELRAAAGDAGRALEDFAGWLQKDLLPRSRGDFALGRERLMELLRRQEGVDVTPELLVSLGERELKEARRRYDDAARALLAGRTGVDVGKLVEEDHPKADELLTVAQQLAESAVAFAREQHLLTPPAPERPKVVEMPAALWGFMQLQLAGPLEPRPRQAYLYVDPVDKGWRDKLKQEHLRTLNRAMMVRTILHEALGHYVQAELDRHAPTTMQKVAMSPLLLEGWASYIEELMVDQGFMPGDERLRLVVARDRVVRAARLVAAVRLHALGAKLDDAIKVFTDEGGLDDYPARREAERAALDPMVLSAALGRIAILKLRDDWRATHADAPLEAFHDALLRHGTPSPIFLRRVLLPGNSASPL